MLRSELTSSRAEALFSSGLQRSEDPTPMQVRAAVEASLRSHGIRGCAERVAHEFGDHPLEAVARMSWVLDEIRLAYAEAQAVR